MGGFIDGKVSCWVWEMTGTILRGPAGPELYGMARLSVSGDGVSCPRTRPLGLETTWSVWNMLNKAYISHSIALWSPKSPSYATSQLGCHNQRRKPSNSWSSTAKI